MITPGLRVNITGLQTTIPLRGVTVLESSNIGVVVIREGTKNANPEFYPWSQITKIEILPQLTPQTVVESADTRKAKRATAGA
jgi:hypothetical protein